MHEVSIAEGLMGIIRETVIKHRLTKVESIKLRIGAMRQVVPEALKFAFEIVGKGTIAEGARIDIIAIPTRARCLDCRCEFTVEDYCFICTSCSSGNLTVIEGKELYIDSLEGE